TIPAMRYAAAVSIGTCATGTDGSGPLSTLWPASVELGLISWNGTRSGTRVSLQFAASAPSAAPECNYRFTDRPFLRIVKLALGLPHLLRVNSERIADERARTTLADVTRIRNVQIKFGPRNSAKILRRLRRWDDWESCGNG